MTRTGYSSLLLKSTVRKRIQSTTKTNLISSIFKRFGFNAFSTFHLYSYLTFIFKGLLHQKFL
jgi:hypothetical protein